MSIAANELLISNDVATGSKFIELLRGIYGGKFKPCVTYSMRYFLEREHRKRFYVFVENIPCTLLTKKQVKCSLVT